MAHLHPVDGGDVDLGLRHHRGERAFGGGLVAAASSASPLYQRQIVFLAGLGMGYVSVD